MAELIEITRDKYGYPITTKLYDELRNKFAAVVGGSNPLTPYILGYAEINDGVIEVSYGTTVDPGAYPGMYGITVVVNGKKCKQKSTCVFSRQQVYEYLNSFK